MRLVTTIARVTAGALVLLVGPAQAQVYVDPTRG